MKWTYRRYKVWVINTKKPVELYIWDNWKHLCPSIDTLLTFTNEQAFMRSYQLYDSENRWLGFGRMPWGEECNKKWTTQYKNEAGTKAKLSFHQTEIWAPDWNKVSKENIPPDVFIKLYHHPSIESIKEGLVVVIPNNIYKRNKTLADAALAALTTAIPDATLTSISRFWQPFGKFVNNIHDMNPSELQKIVALKK